METSTTLTATERIEQLEQQLEDLKARMPEDRATIVVFSGDLDKVLAAFVIATGAAAAGLETSMFFTFWGLCVLKKKGVTAPDHQSIKEKMFGMMTPSGRRRTRCFTNEFLWHRRVNAAVDDEGEKRGHAR